jgi:hypothetical protein
MEWNCICKVILKKKSKRNRRYLDKKRYIIFSHQENSFLKLSRTTLFQSMGIETYWYLIIWLNLSDLTSSHCCYWMIFNCLVYWMLPSHMTRSTENSKQRWNGKKDNFKNSHPTGKNEWIQVVLCLRWLGTKWNVRMKNSEIAGNEQIPLKDICEVKYIMEILS